MLYYLVIFWTEIIGYTTQASMVKICEHKGVVDKHNLKGKQIGATSMIRIDNHTHSSFQSSIQVINDIFNILNANWQANQVIGYAERQSLFLGYRGMSHDSTETKYHTNEILQ